ncbi:hypothetical protein GQ55_6G022300 [Panicum hallii var. hallii]|uniref:Uncharacterized protein n=1 Tax=Panicum hallii var. hallii TaxID=1504633 RepID=A0A2T7D341_9POAL|nr:hypothetical protein GQ55_6G022300 [Panicum hallii var. hallii]
MSACFGTVPTGASCRSSSRRPGGGGRRPWRWWRAKCAGIAAAVGSRIRRSIRGIDGRRHRWRATPSSSSVHEQSGRWCHHRRSFAPVYVDELYSHHHQPAKAALRVVRATAAVAAPPPVAHAAVRAMGSKAADASSVPARAGAAAGTGARASSGKQQAAAAGVVGGAMRNVLLRSPGSRGGGVLGVVKGMGEVDLRAELFIRKFKEDMRLQSQRSAEEFQAMLARGL